MTKPLTTSWEDVKPALESPNYKWRTVRGISKQLNVSQTDIRRVLMKNLGEIAHASVQASTGEELYTTEKHYKVNTSILGRVFNLLTNIRR